jgi:hypothetical protein
MRRNVQETERDSLSQCSLVSELHPVVESEPLCLREPEGCIDIHIHDYKQDKISTAIGCGQRGAKRHLPHMRGIRCRSILRLFFLLST